MAKNSAIHWRKVLKYAALPLLPLHHILLQQRFDGGDTVLPIDFGQGGASEPVQAAFRRGKVYGDVGRGGIVAQLSAVVKISNICMLFRRLLSSSNTVLSVPYNPICDGHIPSSETSHE